MSTSRYTALLLSSRVSIFRILTTLAYLCILVTPRSKLTPVPVSFNCPYPTDTDEPTNKLFACAFVTGKYVSFVLLTTEAEY